MTSAFLIQNELMPRRVFDASRMASLQASSNPFGDCAMTSIFRTIDIGLSSHCILPAPNTSVRKRTLRHLVSLEGQIASVTADGAYDGEPVYQAVARRQSDPVPDI